MTTKGTVHARTEMATPAKASGSPARAAVRKDQRAIPVSAPRSSARRITVRRTAGGTGDDTRDAGTASQSETAGVIQRVQPVDELGKPLKGISGLFRGTYGRHKQVVYTIGTVTSEDFFDDDGAD